MSAVKITLDGETRRFPAGSLPLHSLDEVSARLASEFPSGDNGRYTLLYTDEEGDVVTIRSQSEFEEALSCLRATNKVPRFTLAKAKGEGKKEDEKASPVPPFFSFLGDVIADVQKEVEGHNGSDEHSAESAQPPKRLPFPFGAFPIQISVNKQSPPPPEAPEQRQQRRTSRHPRHSPFSGHFPACGAGMAGLADRANCRAIHLMKKQDYKGAAVMLEKAASHWPCHANTHYNLACTRALSGECDAAVDSLRRSLDLGFGNKALLLSDPDLDALRERPDFAQLLAQHTATGSDPSPEQAGRGCPKHTTGCSFAHSLSDLVRPMPATCHKPEEPKQHSHNEAPAPPISCPDGSTKSFVMTRDEEVVEEVVVESEEEEEATEDPFQYAREFAMVREIGVAVSDTVLRSLLEAHNGDVGATMAELCTTPR